MNPRQHFACAADWLFALGAEIAPLAVSITA